MGWLFKMNILYGVAGVGFGHSSRALLIAKYLENRGHRVKIVTYGDGWNVLRDKFDCMKVNGLNLVFEKGSLKKKKTFRYNVKSFPKNFLGWRKFYRMMKNFQPDLCISDMEPLVPILSCWYRLPLVSIDNQHLLTNFKVDVPRKYRKEFLLTKETIKTFVRKADKFIVTSFANLKARKKNSVIVPPIVRGEVQKLKPKTSGPILVYLSKSDKSSLKVLGKFDEKFVVYGFNIKKTVGNIEFRTRETFLRDLGNCKCVIGTAGFSLMSEAIYLNKPYLAIPLLGQIEQIMNAVFLEKVGFGDWTEELSEKDVGKFLGKLNFYLGKLKKYNPNYGKLFSEIDKALKSI